MKKNKSGKLILGLGIIILFGIAVIWSLVNKNQKKGDDFKIGILADDGIAIVSISNQRKMINTLKIGTEVKLWVPEGLGWYRSGAMKKILQQENKVSLFDKVLFYNFGFVPDKIVVLKKTDDWKNKFWWQYFWNSGKMILKNEVIDKEISQSSDLLDEIMVRDFAESKVVNEDLKLSMVNMTNMDGLADFMATNFERLGFSVISVSNDVNNGSGCQITYGPKVEETFSWRLLSKIIDCPKKKDLTLNDNEVEFYFDEKFASVIKYPSYK
jgi:hypothetical protein